MSEFAFPKPAPRERKRTELRRGTPLRAKTRIKAKRETARRGPPRDRWYMDQVKGRLSCCARYMASPCWGPVDPSHTGEDGGAGMKSSDYSCVPKCRGHHQEWEERTGVFAGWSGLERARWADRQVRNTQERIGVAGFLDILGLAVTFRACPISARPVEQHQESSDPICHFVILRRDLPRGSAAAQCVHAAGESSPGNLGPDTYAVVLAVENEAELVALDARLALHGVARRAIREPTMGNAMTAIGLVPGRKSEVGRWVSSIPLYR